MDILTHQEKYKNDPNYANTIMQLNEKGLLSGETLLKVIGFDAKQEKDKRGDNGNGINDSQYLEKKTKLEVQTARMEHARRNIEVLFKYRTSVEEKEITKVMDVVIKNSLDVMKDIKAIQ